MKVCPHCKTQYSDVTLNFCLQDGTPLTDARLSDLATIAMTEVETVAAQSEASRLNFPERESRTYSERSAIQPGTTPNKGSSTKWAVALTAIGMLVIGGIVALSAWIYLQKNQNKTVKNTDVSRVLNSPDRTPIPPKPTVPANTAPQVPAGEQAEIRSQIAEKIDKWRSWGEAANIDEYMGLYVPKVDYYLKDGADVAFVRKDKEGAFSKFDQMRIKILNISIEPSASGDEATATFDKEWDFSGERSSKGKVRQMLRFENVDGNWLITAEKDLKVYSKN